MRIAPTSTIVVTDLEPNQRIVDDEGKRWVVDYALRRADTMEAHCFPAGREVSRRKVIKYKLTDTVTVELSPEVGKAILDSLVAALVLSPKCQSKDWDGDKATTKPEILIEELDGGGVMLTGAKPHVWQLELEP